MSENIKHTKGCAAIFEGSWGKSLGPVLGYQCAKDCAIGDYYSGNETELRPRDPNHFKGCVKRVYCESTCHYSGHPISHEYHSILTDPDAVDRVYCGVKDE